MANPRSSNPHLICVRQARPLLVPGINPEDKLALVALNRKLYRFTRERDVALLTTQDTASRESATAFAQHLFGHSGKTSTHEVELRLLETHPNRRDAAALVRELLPTAVVLVFGKIDPIQELIRDVLGVGVTPFTEVPYGHAYVCDLRAKSILEV